jgi:hypothetical protein
LIATAGPKSWIHAIYFRDPDGKLSLQRYCSRCHKQAGQVIFISGADLTAAWICDPCLKEVALPDSTISLAVSDEKTGKTETVSNWTFVGKAVVPAKTQKKKTK